VGPIHLWASHHLPYNSFIRPSWIISNYMHIPVRTHSHPGCTATTCTYCHMQQYRSLRLRIIVVLLSPLVLSSNIDPIPFSPWFLISSTPSTLHIGSKSDILAVISCWTITNHQSIQLTIHKDQATFTVIILLHHPYWLHSLIHCPLFIYPFRLSTVDMSPPSPPNTKNSTVTFTLPFCDDRNSDS